MIIHGLVKTNLASTCRCLYGTRTEVDRQSFRCDEKLCVSSKADFSGLNYEFGVSEFSGVEPPKLMKINVL